MSVLKAVIIEDEISSLYNLNAQLETHCPQVEVVDFARSVEEGVRILSNPNLQVDVAFLDISLGDGLVFQLLNELRERQVDIHFDIIFVTAYKEYAIKACQYSSIGYLLKPIDPEELKEAVSRIQPGKAPAIQERLEAFQQKFRNPNSFEKIFISSADGVYFFHIKEIVCLEAEDNYTHIFLKSGQKITDSKTIKWYEDMLTPVNFFRVHKSYIVNLNYMVKYIRGEGGTIVMENGKQIDVSRRRKKIFLDKLRELQDLVTTGAMQSDSYTLN